jgi:stage II sporulation protein AA (anti-sigma F factor antagonist)
MHIQAEARDNYTVLHLRGEFDTFYCPLLLQEVEGLIAAGERRVVLNMRLVRFVNSTALGTILKAHKAMQAVEGALSISRPSTFVRDILEKVGIDKIVGVHDSDESAGAALTDEGATAGDDDTLLDLDDGGSILFTLVDGERLEHFVARSSGAITNPVHGHAFGSNWRGIGRMATLDAENLSFTWDGGKTGLTPFEMGQLLALGTELAVKFRLPLLRKGHLAAEVTVTAIEERADGVKVAARFGDKTDTATSDAVRQYAQDIAFLKQELPKRGE